MERFIIHQIDESTYVVVDWDNQREYCVVSNYDDFSDAEQRAMVVAHALNLLEVSGFFENKPPGFG